ncbi:unnamed protein product [Paramecium sonneborni]|uniref:Uncharacterized protein n=1 Tax=Paramecium sonneborni TaxID=65129 RepID=A0A8S1R0T0_9CILI|nr:unnamed protein product [Paramecium sonneborni]
MSKTKEDYLNILKGLSKDLQQEIKQQYLQICTEKYFDRDLIVDCMYDNLKIKERNLNDFILTIDAHSKFYEAHKESINSEDIKAQLKNTKKLVADWVKWYENITQKQS